MEKRKILAILVLVLGLMVCQAEVSEAGPMGTAFTYQGHLYDANHVADGLYDFQFKLYDANVGAGKVGNDVNVPNVDVIDALFTVELDFGSDVFNGDARWLEIGVRPGDLNDPNVYTTLSPRQEVTPVPYALHTRWLLVDTALDNIFAGEGAGASNTTGNYNSATGNYALYSNTTGNYNSAMGRAGLYFNTTGNYNSAVGNGALRSNTTGIANSAVGNGANYYNQAGSRNTIIGYEAGKGTALHNKSGNVFLGYQAGYWETGDNKLYIENSDSGSPLIYGEFDNDILVINGDVGIGTSSPDDKLDVDGHINSSESYKLDGETVLSNTGTVNIFVGKDAGASNTTGIANSAVGVDALRENTTGYYNTAVGFDALRDNTTGYWNSAVGFRALWANTTGYSNSAMGNYSLWSNTTGRYNSAVGFEALYNNTEGIENSAMGFNALRQNTTGNYNSAVGAYSLKFNTEGIHNSAVGYQALYSNTIGNLNSAVGRAALYCNTTGSENSAVGFCALDKNTTGGWNSAMGYRALWSNSGGSSNSAFGYAAGYSATGSGNVFLGYKAGYNETGSNKLYIANSEVDPPLIYGEFDTGKVGIGTSSPGYKLDVAGQAISGVSNSAPGAYSTISGGKDNTASEYGATVSGGYANTASEIGATVPGGRFNDAMGAFSFAAGHEARAEYPGMFVWAGSTGDLTEGPFPAPTETNFTPSARQFLVRAVGGAVIVTGHEMMSGRSTSGVKVVGGGGSWSSLSDRNAKANINQVDGREILGRLAQIPVSTWNYKSQDPSVRHIGPMAQDFYSAFGVGEDENFITTIDADGVALAAIQGLHDIVKEKEAEIAELKERLSKLETMMAKFARKQEGGI